MNHLADIWEAMADSLPLAPALIHDDAVLSWSQFEDRAARLASALASFGVGPGSVVAIDLYNCSDYLVAFFATVKLRASPANVNYRYVGAELRQLLENCRADVLIFHSSLKDRVADALTPPTTVRASIEVHDVDGVGSAAATADFESLLATHDPHPRIQRDPNDVFLSFTGGTTGLPKAVMYRLGAATTNAIRTRGLILGNDLGEGTDPVEDAQRLHATGLAPVSIPASPLMHSTGLQFASFPALIAGGCVVTDSSRHFDAVRLLQAVSRHRATAMAIVGDAFARPMLSALNDAAASGAPFDTSSLRCIASAGVTWSAEVKLGLLDHMPQVVLMDGCGSTEGAHYGSQLTRHGELVETGRFIPNPGVKIVDQAHHEVGPGEAGLIVAPTVATGYLNDDDASARTFLHVDDQWYTIPGDFGRIDSDGYLTLLGRGSSIINRGGEKIFPDEIEHLIVAHHDVEDVLVFGTPDERFGQAVSAIVQLRPGSHLNEEHVKSLVREQAASYKVPRRVLIAPVPRFPNGKPDFAAATKAVSEEAS